MNVLRMCFSGFMDNLLKPLLTLVKIITVAFFKEEIK